MISQELSTEEHGGENTSASFGISLEVTFPFLCFSCESEQPQDEGCEHSDEKERFESFWVFRLSVAQGEPPAVTFEVTKGLFDFHTACVRTLDERSRTTVVWE
jgi:hypothetical protein